MIVCKYYMNVFRRGENSLRCLDFFNGLPVLDLGGGAHSLGNHHHHHHHHCHHQHHHHPHHQHHHPFSDDNKLLFQI